jgi:hypothetical protein
MSTSTLDSLLNGGGKSAKFPSVGTSYTGKVTSVEVRQATNFDTGEPESWPDGNPKQQIVVSLETNLQEDADDDGARSIYIKAWGDSLKAFRQANKTAGGTLASGDTFTATYVADGPKPARGYPPKIYKYEIKKGSPLDAVVGDVWAPAEAAAPAAAPSDKKDQIEKLIALSLTDEQIAKALGVFEAEAAAVRLQLAANSSKGF